MDWLYNRQSNRHYSVSNAPDNVRISVDFLYSRIGDRWVWAMRLQTAEAFCMEMAFFAMALHTCTKLLSQVRFYTAQGYFVHSTTQDGVYSGSLYQSLSGCIIL